MEFTEEQQEYLNKKIGEARTKAREKALSEAESRYSSGQKEAVSSLLDELGVDDVDSLKEAVKAKPEKDSELKRTSRQNKKLMEELEGAKALLSEFHAKENSRLISDALNNVIGEQSTKKQADMVRLALMSDFTVEEGSVVHSSGEKIEKVVGSYLEENPFLKAPSKTEVKPSPGGVTSKEAAKKPSYEMPFTHDSSGERIERK